MGTAIAAHRRALASITLRSTAPYGWGPAGASSGVLLIDHGSLAFDGTAAGWTRARSPAGPRRRTIRNAVLVGPGAHGSPSGRGPLIGDPVTAVPEAGNLSSSARSGASPSDHL